MKFYIHKLGCPKNDVDADYITARLIASGHQPVSSPDRADSVIVNTCGFILPAKEESIDEILALGKQKKEGKFSTLYAAGCLAQRYGDDLLAEMPELDGAFGHGVLDELTSAVSDSKRLKECVRIETCKLDYLDWTNRFISDQLPYSYVKISDGCNRTCSFCAIPGIRGAYRSRPVDSIINEARFLAENGKKELILVSQEATLYGYDLKDGSNLLNLLEQLEKVACVEWIRLLYLHPAQMSPELIGHMTSGSKTLSYFDLPLQHINDDILSGMQRQTSRWQIEGVLDSIRSADREAVIRTAFIVGFPGETDRQFEDLTDFVERFQFDRLGVFTFSPEDDTPAAVMGRQLPEEVKMARMDELMSLQQEIAFAKNNSLIGSVKEVIIDSGSGGDSAVGRTRGDCPEIDQQVFVSGDNLMIGDIHRVTIEAADGYDLRGTMNRESKK
jgi:ribosomal protein S12 methylthiotransferase